ncbi:MAG: TolC family protein [Planctomycetota bacterium]
MIRIRFLFAHAAVFRAIVPIFFLLLLIPCASVRAQDPVPTPPVIAATDNAPPRKVLRITLKEAIDIALQRNLDLRLEYHNAFIAHEEIGIAAAAFDPIFATNYTMAKFRQPTVDFLSGIGGAVTSVEVNPSVQQRFDIGVSGLTPIGTEYSVTASDRRSDNPDSGFFGINPRNNTSLALNLTQPLLDGFGFAARLADKRIAGERARIAADELRTQREVLVAAVRDAYWILRFHQANLAVKEQALEEARTLLEINRQKVQVGTAIELDIIDAEANIETQNGDIIDAKNTLERARDTLLDLLNYQDVLRENNELQPSQAPYDHLNVELTTEFPIETSEIVTSDAIQLALSERSDLRATQRQIEVARIELVRRDNQLLPAFNLTGSWTQNGLEKNIGNSIDELFSGRYYDWEAGVNFEMPFGNRRDRHRASQGAADFQSAKLNFEKLRNSIVLEVAQSVRGIASARQKITARRAASRARGEQLQGEKERLRLGTSTSYQVLQLQNDLLEAQSEELRALVDYQTSVTAYKKAVGILLLD